MLACLHSLLASYKTEIKSLAPVKPGNAKDYRKFYNFVLKRDTFSTNWNSLETQELVLVSELPGGLMDRWNRKVQGIGGVMAGNHVCQISRFVNEETILATAPIFSKEAVQEHVTHPEKKLN